MIKQSILRVSAAFAASLLLSTAVNAMGVGANMKPDMGALIKHEIQFVNSSIKGNSDSMQNFLETLPRGNGYGFGLQGHVPQGSFLIGAGLATEVQQNLKNEIARNNSRFGSTSVVPIPAAVWLLGSGLSFLAFFGRKNVKARA